MTPYSVRFMTFVFHNSIILKNQWNTSDLCGIRSVYSVNKKKHLYRLFSTLLELNYIFCFFFPTDKAMAHYTLRDPTASINKTKLTSYFLSHLKPKVVKGSYLHSLFRHSKGKYCLIFLINLPINPTLTNAQHVFDVLKCKTI